MVIIKDDVASDMAFNGNSLLTKKKKDKITKEW
jgi:hypothetical protein